MMRSLFSGVAGLKTHQTRMDVIGNNIANVNTTAYKSQSMVFNDLLYQTTQAASGANNNTGRGGINPRQIGLGAKTGAISTAITMQGSAQSTNNPWDVMIEGESFFIVSDGSSNFFTRDGSFTVDGAGNLVMASTGFTVMGWQVDPETGDIKSDIVSALQVMHPDNLRADPEATTVGYMSGILDKTDTNINSTSGKVVSMTFFDAQGYKYSAIFSVHGVGSDDEFRVQLDDILDNNGVSLVTKYGLSNINEIANFGDPDPRSVTSKFGMGSGIKYDAATKTYTLEKSKAEILEGYSNNAMVVAAGEDNVKITSPSTSGAVAKGTEVTVEGKVSLKKAQLESEPYNLIYDTETKKYYKTDDTGALKAVGDGTGEIPWKDALKSMKGLETLDTVTVTQDDDNQENVTITFTAKFKTTEDSTLDAERSVFGIKLVDDGTLETRKKILEDVYQLKDGDGKTYGISFVGPDGSAQITMSENNIGNMLVFDHDNGHFSYIGTQGSNTAWLRFNPSAATLTGNVINLSQFSDIEIDFSSVSNLGNGGKSTLELTNGTKGASAIGAGRKVGELIGLEIGQDGRITASYDNGLSKLIGQIAVAEFANASGLAKAGNNLYSATQNSGEFDGVGTDITANGGKMESGVLEMSNVDLSSEFTTMITTQRGFQANSRIITVSDTLLEELVNLKR